MARRLGDCLTAGEVRAIARRLRREGVNIPRRPDGPVFLGHAFLFRDPDGDY